MPGVVSRLAAAKLSRVLGDNPPILANDDTIGVGLDFHQAVDIALECFSRQLTA